MKIDMNDRPLVSVITIFLNAAKFIEEAIQSVLSQSYPNWELLLVDDGSTDSSTDIALKYARAYPEKIRYLEHQNHENRGMSAARNLGIENARGKYIAILDSDDLWMPKKLEHQVAIMESHPAASMVYGPVLFWYSWTGQSEDLNKDFMTEFGVQLNTLIEPPVLLTVYYPLGTIHPPCLSNLLARNDSLDDLGWFEETFGLLPKGLCDDLPFFSKVHLKKAVFISSECLTRYRQHAASAVSSVMKERQFKNAELFFLEWLEEFLRKQKIGDSKIWQALERAVWPHHHPFLCYFAGVAQRIKQQMKWLFHRAWLLAARLKHSVFGSMSGKITCEPNPILVRLIDRFPILTGETTLSWEAIGTETVEVRVDAPDGPLFSQAGSSGRAVTGKWVRDGMVFYLQDVSGGKLLTLTNTMDAVRVRVYHAKN